MRISVKLYSKTGSHIIPSLLFLLTTIFSSEPSPAFRERQEFPRILGGELSSSGKFPFLCTVHAEVPHHNFTLGSCTILSSTYVLFSIDAYDRYLTHFKTPPATLYVYGGGVTLEHNNWNPGVSGTARLVQRLIIGTRPKITAYDKYDDFRTQENPQSPMDDETVFMRNALGDLYNDVGLLRLRDAFVWDGLVVQAPLIARSMDQIRKEFKIIHETENYSDCVIPGWGPLGENYLVSQRVVHIPFDDCLEAICGQVPTACLKYPIKHYHVCFKSTSYGDVCEFDQGAPLFCPWFENSVLAVLVKAFDCGLTSLPGVYALMDRAADIRYNYIARGETSELQPYFNWTAWEAGIYGSTTRKPVTEGFDND